ncbi:MAG TPA: serine/threonine-protein kinase [Candidatus Acidoferrales bacterium]|nr:serine/threonine-protein kinase [Candidatus Acidoferrales bacterium]
MSLSANSDPTRRPVSTDAEKQCDDTVALVEPGASAGDLRQHTRQQGSESTESARTTVLDPESARLGVLSSRYDILSEAGRGSMGNVYKARDRETGEVVALKLLKQEISSDQTMIERFKNELLFARRITHKNVCRMYDFNRIDGTACTSMEYVDGESLRSALNRSGGMTVGKALTIAKQICSGLKEAHAQGIVHRDLKPENVMIDTQGNVKIMDFGIARSMEAATRLTGSMMGTPAYMAPEQVTGKPVDYRTDIYALGLVLYEMFTGVQACQAETPVAAAMKQIRETPPLPHEIDPTIPVGVEKTILKCLEKEPTRRFQSVAELEKALTAPSVTDTSPGFSGREGLPLSALSTSLSTKTSVRRPVGGSAPATERHARRISPLVWTLLGALLVVATLAGARWARITRRARLIQPPASLPAPKPPAIASRTTGIGSAPTAAGAATTAGTVHISQKTKPPTKDRAPASETVRVTPGPLSGESSKPPIDTEVFPRVERGVKKSARQIELEKVPADVQQRANSAFGETKNPAADPSATEFVWIGRYERERRAQEAVQTIRNLGLPARITRHGWQRAFWVVAGPFTPKEAPDDVAWLKSQGFKGAREIRPAAASKQRRSQPE